MRSIIALPLAAACLLSACGTPEDQAQTPEQAAAAAAQLPRPEPGLYRSTVNILEFEIPGLPQQQLDHMKQAMKGVSGKSSTFCLTAQDVEEGYEEMVRKSAEGDCTFQKFQAGATTLDAKMSCKMDQGAMADIAMQGDITPALTHMVMQVDQSGGQVPGGKIHTRMEVTNERIGDCP